MADQPGQKRLCQEASSYGAASLDPSIYFPIYKTHLLSELFHRLGPNIRYQFDDYGFPLREGDFTVTYLPRDPTFDKYGQDPLDCSWKWTTPASMSDNSEDDWGADPEYPGDELLGEPGLAVVDRIVTTTKDDDGSVDVKLYLFPCKTFAKKKDPQAFVDALPEEERRLLVPLAPSQSGQGHGTVPPGTGSSEPITFPGPAKFRLVRPTWVMAVCKEITVTPRFRRCYFCFNKGAQLPKVEIERIRQYARVLADLKLKEEKKVSRQQPTFASLGTYSSPNPRRPVILFETPVAMLSPKPQNGPRLVSKPVEQPVGIADKAKGIHSWSDGVKELKGKD